MGDEEYKNLPPVTLQGAIVGAIAIGFMALVFYKSAESYMQRGWSVLWRDVSFLIIAPVASSCLGLFLGVKLEKTFRLLTKDITISDKLSALSDLFSAKTIAIILITATVVSYYLLTVPHPLRSIYLLCLFGPVAGFYMLRFILFALAYVIVFLRKR